MGFGIGLSVRFTGWPINSQAAVSPVTTGPPASENQRTAVNLNQHTQRTVPGKGKWSYGEELRESSEQKAERLVKAALREQGWKESDLAKRPKGDRAKVKIALQLREQSVMTLEWIAQRLQMGTRTYLNHLLYWQRRQGTREMKR